MRPRTVVQLLQLGGGIEYGVDDNCLDNGISAITERVYFVESGGKLQPPPQPKPGVIRSRLAKFRGKLVSRMCPTPPVDVEDYPNMYKGRKQKIYQRAVESLRVRPVEPSDSYISAFVKAEKVNLTDKVDPAPRLIQPRSPRYNVEVGRYLKPNEHAFYKAIGRVWRADVVAKGLNAVDRGRHIAWMWEQFTDPVAVGLDAKRFDQHVSEDMLRWEHSVYNSVIRSGTLRRLLKWQIRNRCFLRVADGSIKFDTIGGRKSGDMNTALGNVLIMCAMMWSYVQEIGVTVQFFNDGDDCVLIMERSDQNRFCGGIQQWFLDFGFQMKIEGVFSELEQIVFCQSQPVWDGEGYRMVRDIRSSLSKDLITVKTCQNERDWDRARGAISDCGLALAGQIPVMNSFYRMLGTGSMFKREGELETGMDYLARGLDSGYSQPTDRTRYSFFRAFNITPDEQVALEQYYDMVNPTWSGLGPRDPYYRSNIDEIIQT